MENIQVAILEDHQGIIDGVRYRLQNEPDIEIVATMRFGELLEPTLAAHPVDVLLLDVRVPISQTDSSQYRILQVIPMLLEKYPNLEILVMTMTNNHRIVQMILNTGVSGYILKDDDQAIENIADLIRGVKAGRFYISPQVELEIKKDSDNDTKDLLTRRQLQVLNICMQHPDWSTAEMAREMHLAHSTVRNTLSAAYIKLQATNRISAIARAIALGYLPLDTEKTSFFD